VQSSSNADTSLIYTFHFSELMLALIRVLYKSPHFINLKAYSKPNASEMRLQSKRRA